MKKQKLDSKKKAEKLFREIMKSVKIKQKMKDGLGMTGKEAANHCGDDVY